MAMVELDMYRIPEAEKVSIACTYVLAEELNIEVLTSDNAPRDFAAPDETECDKFGCAGYRSRLEVINQHILRKGYTLGAMVIDSPRFGNLEETMYRINMANFRKIKGLPEPGLEWYEVPWFILLVFGTPVLLIIIVLCVIGCLNPLYCPLCIQKTCCGKHAKRLRRQAAKEKEEQARLQEEIDGLPLQIQDEQGLGKSGQGYGQPQFQNHGPSFCQSSPANVYGQSQFPSHGQSFNQGSPAQPQFPSHGPSFCQNSFVQPQFQNHGPSFCQSSPAGFYGQPQSPRQQGGMHFQQPPLPQQWDSAASAGGRLGPQPPYQGHPQFQSGASPRGSPVSSPNTSYQHGANFSPAHSQPVACAAGSHWPAAPADRMFYGQSLQQGGPHSPRGFNGGPHSPRGFNGGPHARSRE